MGVFEDFIFQGIFYSLILTDTMKSCRSQNIHRTHLKMLKVFLLSVVVLTRILLLHNKFVD